MVDPRPFHLKVYEGEDWRVRAYIENTDDGAALALADLATASGDTGMDVRVYDENTDPSKRLYQEISIDISVAGADAVWYPTLLDAGTTPVGPNTTGWSKSPPGANFDWTLTDAEYRTGGVTDAGTNYTAVANTGAIGGHRYRVEVMLNKSGGGVIAIVGFVDVAPLDSK